MKSFADTCDFFAGGWSAQRKHNAEYGLAPKAILGAYRVRSMALH